MQQTDFKQFSLLYPDQQALRAHMSGEDAPLIDGFTLEELGLPEILPLRNSSLSDFFTADPDVIRYRQEIFGDLLAFEDLSATFSKLIPVLFDIMELRRLESDSGETADYLSSMTEIELYISSIDVLYHGLCKTDRSYSSDALTQLAGYIKELVESDYYAELNERLAELTNRVREIKSVTIGVNLDTQLRPREAGVLSINPEPFRSGDTLQKILRLNFKESSYTCIADLVPFGKKQSENQKTALSLAFNSAINDVYRQSLRSWKKIVQTYVLENTDFLLDLLPNLSSCSRPPTSCAHSSSGATSSPSPPSCPPLTAPSVRPGFTTPWLPSRSTTRSLPTTSCLTRMRPSTSSPAPTVAANRSSPARSALHRPWRSWVCSSPQSKRC